MNRPNPLSPHRMTLQKRLAEMTRLRALGLIRPTVMQNFCEMSAMKPPRVRWNTTEARIERYVRLAQRLELPVYGFEVRGRDVTVLTRPREDGPAQKPPTENDPVSRWFCDNAGADHTPRGRRTKSP